MKSDRQKISEFIKKVHEKFPYLPEQHHNEIGEGSEASFEEDIRFYFAGNDYHTFKDFKNDIEILSSRDHIQISIPKDKNFADIDIEKILEEMTERISKRADISRAERIVFFKKAIKKDEESIAKKNEELKKISNDPNS